MLKSKATPKVLFKKRDNCSKKKIRKLVKYFRSELESSTTHGLPYILNTRLHWFERTFWSVSFILSVAVIFWLLSKQYKRFVKTPILMSVEMDYFNWNVSYPAIYLCPLDKADDFLLSSFINDTLRDTGKDLSQYIDSIISATLIGVHLIQAPSAEILSLINASDYATIAAGTYRRMSDSTVTTVDPWTVGLETSMTEMGMCDVINSNVATFDNPLKWRNKEETFTRNNVELSFQNRDFFVQIMNYADSYKIYIQSPNDVIQIGMTASTFDEEGFLNFGVHMSSTETSKDLRNLPVDLRKCRYPDEPNRSRYPVYSYNRCLIECRARMILTLCGCVPHFYKPLEHEKVCNLAELKCVEDYRKEILSISISNETAGKFQSSYDLPRSARDCGCLDNCEYTSYRRDEEVFLPQEAVNRLQINVATFPKVRIYREIMFSAHDIFLRSGGVVNFCIGASVLSVMELVLTLVRIPIYQVQQLLQCIFTRKQISKAQVKKIEK